MKFIEGKQIYTVSEVNSRARQTLEKMAFWVEGEIFSFKGTNHHYRYLYFDLKDPQTGFKLPCILEPEVYLSLEFSLEEGKRVLVLGNLSLYEKEGRFQMYIQQIQEYGEGVLLAEFEELKRRLQAKGYFDTKYKKPLPKYPVNIAVISSKVGDAWFDFKKHTVDQFPIIQITLFDVMVQGPEAPAQIAESIKRADSGNFNAIVLIRGGGSLEDLAAFNDERVAGAIFRAKTCIVVGVGHEKDVTIAQLVADVAASTPTDAAKIITTDFVNLEEKLTENLLRAKRAIGRLFLENSQSLDLIFQRLIHHQEKFRSIASNLEFLKQGLTRTRELILNQNLAKLEFFKSSLSNSWKFNFQKNQNILQKLFEKLLILSPETTLSRGYSIVTDEENHIIKDAAVVDIGSVVRVQFARGKVRSRVFTKEL